jgi:hypothetical protein
MKIKPCNCTHEFQDTRYGKGQRVHTPGKDKIACTVCGRVEAVRAKPLATPEKK